MMQDLWKQVAEQYHVSAEEVQAEITKAIETGMQTAGVGGDSTAL